MRDFDYCLLFVYRSYFTSSNIKYIDNQLVTVIKIQMICKCKYKTGATDKPCGEGVRTPTQNCC